MMRTLLTTGLAVLLLSALSQGALISNGGFEDNPVGTTLGPATTGNIVNSTTFTDWRFVDFSGANSELTATIISGGAEGSDRALQLDLTETGGGAWIDRLNAKMDVEYGSSYDFSFDLRELGGTEGSMILKVSEYNSSGSFVAETATAYYPTADWVEYFKNDWTPSSTTTATISLSFTPSYVGGATSTSLALDNVQMTPEPTTMGLLGLGGLALLRRRK